MSLKFRGWRLALSVVSGLALAFAFPSYNVPLLAWVSIAGLLCAVIGASLPQAALCGFLYYAACYTVAIPWVATVLQQYGPMPMWEAVAIFFLLVMAMSLFCAAFAAAVAWLARRGVALALLAAPFLWVAMELGRMYLPQPSVNFPWLLLGYTVSGNLALVQLTSLTGIWGLSFLVVAFNALVAWVLVSVRRPSRRNSASAVLFATAGVLFAVALAGPRFVPTPPSDHVAHMVQTNLPQALDYPPNWNQIHARDLTQLDRLSIPQDQSGADATAALLGLSSSISDEEIERLAPPHLVIWPEVPAPFSLQQGDFAQRVEGIAEYAHANFLFGEVDLKRGADGRVTPNNSAALMDPNGHEQFLYDKIHLVPFGEFMPWRDELFFAKGLTGLIGDFGVGSHYNVGQLPGGRFSVFICYEAIFPYAARHFVANGAELLINLSNDGWFGRSSAAAQHLAQARVRAVENRRWLLRDTNTGYTVSIDPYGRTRAQMPAQIRGVLDAPFAFRHDRTLYTNWGDWLAYLSLALSACFLAAAALRRPALATAPAKSPRKLKRRK